MNNPDGYMVNGELLPDGCRTTEQAMARYIAKLEKEMERIVDLEKEFAHACRWIANISPLVESQEDAMEIVRERVRSGW